MATPAPDELRDLIVHLLAGATGKAEKHWRKVVGEVEGLPLAFNIRCNWRVSPKGSAADLEAVEAALEIVRKAHPYVV
jgi:hypothetical protein